MALEVAVPLTALVRVLQPQVPMRLAAYNISRYVKDGIPTLGYSAGIQAHGQTMTLH